MTDPLDVPATPDGAEWRRFLARTLTLLGAALVLAGVICFFAFNWDRLGRFAKLGLIEAGIVAATIVAWWRLPRLSGQVAITAAAVLVGPLLGVYGQTYQTGADPYGLFLTWALLIVPWVIGARFTTLWVVEVVLVDVALGLWWSQVGRPSWVHGDFGPGVIVGLVHAAAIVVWEWQIRRRDPWLVEKWAPHELALAGFVALLMPAAAFVLQPTEHYTRELNVVGAVGLALLVGAIAVTLWYYRQLRPDRFMVTAAGAAGLALAAFVVGRLVMVDLELGEFGFLAIAIFVIAEITYGLRWLRETRPPARESERARAPFEGADAESPPPWFARVIAGLGAWVATGFLIGFLVVADLVEGATSATIAGALLLVVGVLVRRRAAAEQDFQRHLALALSLAGQVLLLVGVSDATKSATVAGALAVVMSVILVPLVPDAAHRFMSGVIGSVGAVGAVANLRLVWTLGSLGPLGSFVVRGSDLAVLAVVAVTAYVWRGALRRRSDALAEMLAPVGYGTMVALFGLLLFSTIFAFADEIVRGSRAARANAWHLGPLTTIGITGALVALELRVFAELAKPRAEAVAAAIAASILLGVLTLSTPGVMAAIAALALGFDRRNRIVIGLAIVFLVHFASAYYYSLRMTLLEKSILLAASGVVLLAARAYVELRFKPGEEAET